MTTRYAIQPCPVCGNPAQDEVANTDLLQQEAERLWAFHMRRLRADTPPHRLADRLAFSQRPPLRLAACTECTHIFRNPGERPDELEDTYADEDVSADTLDALHDAQLPAARSQAARLQRRASRVHSVFEVGSYAGGFLTAGHERGWHCTGVDVNPQVIEFGRKRGFDMVHGTIEDVEPGRRFDAVCFWNCLDQLADPAAAARCAASLLNPGGTVVVRVPNGAFYTRWAGILHRDPRGPAATLAVALLAHNNLLTFPYRHGFTPTSLQRLLTDAGFATPTFTGDALVPVADEFTRPLALIEERLVKALLRRLPARASPWLEAWATTPS